VLQVQGGVGSFAQPGAALNNRRGRQKKMAGEGEGGGRAGRGGGLAHYADHRKKPAAAAAPEPRDWAVGGRGEVRVGGLVFGVTAGSGARGVRAPSIEPVQWHHVPL
jgi:hypothetical protein